MQRINVIGTSGSGKSTFSKQLAESLSIPYIEMDKHFWKPNWTESSDEEFFASLTPELAQPQWVLDGNYSRTQALKWKNVDTIIWLDYSFPRTFSQAMKRAIHRIVTQEEFWEGTGNTETFRQTFMSKESILLWTITSYRKVRQRYLALKQDPNYAHIKFIHLTSPQETQVFLKAQSKT